MNVKLTGDQKIAVEAIINFINDPNQEIFTLSGIGGAGKTFCIREALKNVSNVVGATVSHSAKFVLNESLLGIANCYTIAQLLGLIMHIGEDGEISFDTNPNRNPEIPLPIETADLLVIDECSMIDPLTFHRIKSMKNINCKVIFLGDIYQLPPIETSKDSVTFNYTGAELKVPIRYTGPITELGTRIRQEIDKINNDLPATKFVINEWMNELGYGERTSKLDENGSGYIFLNDINKVVEIASKIFKENPDPDSLKLLAYRNSNIEKLNDVIRAQTFATEEHFIDGELKLPQFLHNELIICDGGYGREIYNNQTFKVADVKEVIGPEDVPCLAMKLNPDPRMPEGKEIYCLDYEKGRHIYYDKLNTLKNQAKLTKNWKSYYNFKSKFAYFDYNYSQNAHRALNLGSM